MLVNSVCLVGILATKPMHQEDSRESFHEAIEKTLGSVLVGRLCGRYPYQSSIGTQGRRKVP